MKNFRTKNGIFTGDVGIGTTNPNFPLHINKSDSSGCWTQFTNSATGTSSNSGALVGIDSNQDFRINLYEERAIEFYTSGTPSMRINSAGNVGIGTTSTGGSRLFVKGDQTNAANISISADNSVGEKDASIFFNATRGVNNAGSNGEIRVTHDGGSGLGKMLFSTRRGSGDPTTAMTIDSTGNVGIGTTDPYYKLDIGDGTDDATYLQLTATNTGNSGFLFGDSDARAQGRVEYNHSNDYMRFRTDGTERMRIDSDGNVGIGTTSPDTALHISTTSPSIRLTDTTPATNTVAQVWADSDAAGALLLAADITNVGTNPFISARIGGLGVADEKMRIDSSGNVGIGTTSPDSALHVMQSGDVNDGITLQQVNYAKKLNLRTNSAGELIVDVDDGTVEAMRIDSDGNVGIGTTNPSAVFHVEKHSNLTQSSPHFKIRGNVYTGLHWLNGTAYYIGQDSTTRSMRIFSGDSTTGVELMYGATAWSTFSDERLKENITNLDSVIDKIKDIRCVTYTRSDVENSKETIGFIAQDFIGKFDQVINKSKISDEDKEEYYSIKYTETIPVLMKAIQEQQQTIEDLKSQNESLAARISALES